MAIDVDTETILTIPEACRSIPPRGVSLATFARWLQRGVGPRRIKPESILIGGRRLVSKESLARFFAAQNPDQQPAATITPGQRHKQAETADRLLESALNAGKSPTPEITGGQRTQQPAAARRKLEAAGV